MTAATHKAWRLHARNDLRLDEVETPAPTANGVIVRIEAAMVLSYMGKVLDGTLGYAMPPAPFVPGTNAVGTVEAVGAAVLHLRPGDRVFLSPHLVADERVRDPAQILIGLTATGTSRFDGVPPPSLALQSLWRDGVFAEKAHWPAAAVTPLRGLERLSAERLLGLAKLVVPYGGWLRGRLAAGDGVIVNGASGYFGSAGVMMALAMGASHVVAAGRDKAALEALAARLGPRVVPAVLAGEAEEGRGDAPRRRWRPGRYRARSPRAGELDRDHPRLAPGAAPRRAARHHGKRRPCRCRFPSASCLANDWEVIGAFMYPKDAPSWLVRLAASGLLDLEPIRINRFAFAELPRAIEAAASMRGLDMTAIA